MTILQDLKNTKNKKGLTKTVELNNDLRLLINSLELTEENNQYCPNIVFNSDTLVKYEEATPTKKEGVRVINYDYVFRRNIHRIYRGV